MSQRRIILVFNIVVFGILVFVVAVIGLDSYRQKMIIERPMLDVAFEHSKHKDEPCANCHHNYTDGSAGSGGCYDCHKYTEEISVQMEEIFHSFCRDCHINKAIQQLDAGPLRQCSLCHIDDQIVN